MNASIALLLFLAAVTPAPAARMVAADEAQAIAAAMLDYEIRAHPPDSSVRTCTTPNFGAPLRVAREDRDDRERERHGQPSDFELRLDWALPEPRSDPALFTLDDRRARQLDRMVAAALDTFSPRTAHARRIARGTVPQPLLLGSQANCQYRIALSAPFVVGEVAFIEGNYESGGNIYALERRGNRWVVFALANMWIGTVPAPLPPSGASSQGRHRE